MALSSFVNFYFFLSVNVKNVQNINHEHLTNTVVQEPLYLKKFKTNVTGLATYTMFRNEMTNRQIPDNMVKGATTDG